MKGREGDEQEDTVFVVSLFIWTLDMALRVLG